MSVALDVRDISQKPGNLSVCCSMRVDEEAVTDFAKTRADYRAAGFPLQSLTRNAGSRTPTCS
jgi:hypothetical protein